MTLICLTHFKAYWAAKCTAIVNQNHQNHFERNCYRRNSKREVQHSRVDFATLLRDPFRSFAILNEVSYRNEQTTARSGRSGSHRPSSTSRHDRVALSSYENGIEMRQRLPDLFQHA